MELNKIFCDGMVLQAEKPIRIFGTGLGIATVEIDGIVVVDACGEDKWTVELPPHSYGGPYTVRVVLNDEQRVIKDVYFGDVYLLAGQSNIEYRLKQTNTPKEEYQTNDLVRAFFTKINFESQEYPLEEKWIKADENCVGEWSALGWLFANALSKEKGHAIGIISCYQGASMLQSWLPECIFWGTELDEFTEEKSGHLRAKEYIDWNHDGFLYERKFKKVIPFSFNAVVWYQGESNSRDVKKSADYKCMLKVLINCWRRNLKNDTLPFVIVQISDLTHAANKFGWKAVQKAQLEISDEMDNVYTVISRDICENNNILPPTKLPLAMRIKDVLKKL